MLNDMVASRPEFTGKRARTILVVEDEEPIRVVLTEFLQDCGYHVLEAGNVAEARYILVHRPVDLVFSDINMPGGETGFVLEKWVRREYPRTRVLLTSGFPHGWEDTKDLAEPMLPKPYRCAVLLQRLKRMFCGATSLDRTADATV